MPHGLADLRAIAWPIAGDSVSTRVRARWCHHALCIDARGRSAAGGGTLHIDHACMSSLDCHKTQNNRRQKFHFDIPLVTEKISAGVATLRIADPYLSRGKAHAQLVLARIREGRQSRINERAFCRRLPSLQFRTSTTSHLSKRAPVHNQAALFDQSSIQNQDFGIRHSHQFSGSRWPNAWHSHASVHMNSRKRQPLCRDTGNLRETKSTKQTVR